MSRKMYLSITSLYQYDESVFDYLTVPDGLNKDMVIWEICKECSDNSLIFADLEYMKNAMKYFSLKYQNKWERIFKALQEEYDPLWNTDRNETTTETRDLKGTGSTKVQGWNDGMSDRENAESTDTGTVTITRRAYGNIGVTTNAQMLEGEYDVRAKLNMCQIIVDDFKNEFCIMIY